MAADDKTEAPTPKRKREARRDGRIAKSQELNTWGTILLASFVMPMALGGAGRSVRDLFERTGDLIAQPELNRAVGMVGLAGKAVLLGSLPLAVAVLGFSIVSNVAQSGFAFSTKKLKPSGERINPFKGFKRLFSVESGWNTFKVTMRTVVLAGAAWMPLRHAIDRLGSADQPPLQSMIASIGLDALRMVRTVAVAGLLLGVLDYVVAKRRLMKNLRMTKHEVKEEHKQSEGDPLVRSQIRARQREMSRNRMLAGVGDASVVIVNPIHVAVALKYDAGTGAPRLIAKGKGPIAAKIREEAERHGVPLVRDIPLAWALHDTCKLDHPIPAELYGAVAKVLAFVMTVGKRMSSYGGVLSLNPG